MSNDEIIKLQQKMQEKQRKINAMTTAIGLAHTVIGMKSDNAKRLLAKYAAVYVREGKSDAIATTLARADEKYAEELKTFEAGLQSAYEVKAEYDALHSGLEVARSLHSMANKKLSNFME
jgi:hypothetical protein